MYFVIEFGTGKITGPITADEVRKGVEEHTFQTRDQLIPANPDEVKVQTLMEFTGAGTRKFPRAYLEIDVLVNDSHRIIPTKTIQVGQRGTLITIDQQFYEPGESMKIHIRSGKIHRPILTSAKIVGMNGGESNLAFFFPDIRSDDEEILARAVKAV